MLIVERGNSDVSKEKSTYVHVFKKVGNSLSTISLSKIAIIHVLWVKLFRPMLLDELFHFLHVLALIVLIIS